MTDRAALATKLRWAYPRGPSHVTQEEWRVVLAAVDAAPDQETLAVLRRVDEAVGRLSLAYKLHEIPDDRVAFWADVGYAQAALSALFALFAPRSEEDAPRALDGGLTSTAPFSTEITAPAAACTGVSASWCPIHGECSCGRDDDGQRYEMSHRDCPLHGERSDHPRIRTPGADRAALADWCEDLSATHMSAADFVDRLMGAGDKLRTIAAALRVPTPKLLDVEELAQALWAWHDQSGAPLEVRSYLRQAAEYAASHLLAAPDRETRAIAALQGIATNSCCFGCREAALVAQEALARLTPRSDAEVKP